MFRTSVARSFIAFLARPSVKEYTLIAVFFGLLGLYRFWPALFTPNLSLTNSADGIGGLSGIAFLGDILRENGIISYIFTDYVVNDQVAAGLLPGAASWSVFWRVALLPLVLLGLDAQTIYDVWALAIFIATGVAGYFLARVVGARYLLAIFAGLLYVGMDNVGVRLQAHITLVSPFMILLQTGFAIIAARSHRASDIFLLAIATWLSFLVNEYYGFFAIFYVLTIYVGCLLVYSRNGIATWSPDRWFWFHHFGAFVMLSLLMVVSYPSLILAKLQIGSPGGNLLEQVSHAPSELLHYTVANPFGLFQSSLTGMVANPENPAEFTFRIGVVIVFAILTLGFGTLLGGKKSPSNDKFRRSEWLKLAVVFAAAGSLLALVGLRPDLWRASFAGAFFSMAPMFRVMARSYLLVDISLITILIIVASNFIRGVRKGERLDGFRILAIGAAAVLLLFVYVDVTRGVVPTQFPAVPLPQNAQLFRTVPANAGGMVIELPFWPPSATPEKSYEYLYNWSRHKHPLVNGPFNSLTKTDRELAEKLESFAAEVNRPNPAQIDALGQAGIRYLVANCGGVDYSYMMDFSRLKSLGENGCSRLYEIATFNPDGKFIDLLNKYHAFGTPNPRTRLLPSDCRASISAELLSEGVAHPGKELFFRITVDNLGGKVWGDKGADVQLGTIWFKQGKQDSAHSPNLGEKWIPFRQKIGPGESVTMNAFVTSPGPGDYELWFSPLQPGVMWCFHVGDPPFKTKVEVTP